MNNDNLKEKAKGFLDSFRDLRLKEHPSWVSIPQAINAMLSFAASLELAGNQQEGVQPAHARNWTEDFSYENGNYYNRCRTCQNMFVGHKRRFECKVCSSSLPVQQEPLPAEASVEGKARLVELFFQNQDLTKLLCDITGLGIFSTVKQFKDKWDRQQANTDAARPTPSTVQDSQQGGNRETQLCEALQKIADWQLPETGKFWDEEKTRPLSYEAAYGSNGARDYFKRLATEALNRSRL